jgi:hypothetical protein
MKCLGQPAWIPPGIELESLVVGGTAECCVDGGSAARQLVRVRNYSLKSYNIDVTSKCQTTRLYYPDLMQASPEGKVWQERFSVPFSLDEGGRSGSTSQELAKKKDARAATDQNISINLKAAARGTTGEYTLPEFMIQVDVAQ